MVEYVVTWRAPRPGGFLATEESFTAAAGPDRARGLYLDDEAARAAALARMAELYAAQGDDGYRGVNPQPRLFRRSVGYFTEIAGE